MALAGCDTPPDIHVYAYSEHQTAGDVVLWRVRHSYRLLPREIVHINAWGGLLGDDGDGDHSARFRVTPFGPLPKDQWITLDLARYEPRYKIRQTQSVRVITRFAAGRHLKLEVWLRDPCSPDTPGACSVGSSCPAFGPHCWPASQEEIAHADPPDEPVTQDQVDPDENSWSGDPPTGEVPTPCVLYCDSLPDNDDGQVPGSVGPPPRPDAGHDSGFDAADAFRPDAASAPDADAARDAGDDDADADVGDAADDVTDADVYVPMPP